MAGVSPRTDLGSSLTLEPHAGQGSSSLHLGGSQGPERLPVSVSITQLVCQGTRGPEHMSLAPLSKDVSPAWARNRKAFLYRLQRRVLLGPSLLMRRVRVSGVRGPLTPRPGHQSHVRTGWGAPKRTTCCGRALQRFARLRVCSEGATGMHVTVWGFLSLHWAVIRSTGSCSLQLSQTSKILICMKTRPIDTFSGTSLVCAHMWVHM